MKKLFTLSLLILLAFGLQAQSKNIAYQDETVRFTIITDGVIRMEYAKDGHFVDEASQVAVIRDYPAVDFKVKEGKTIEITTAKLQLKYKKSSGAFTTENLSISSLKGVNPRKALTAPWIAMRATHELAPPTKRYPLKTAFWPPTDGRSSTTRRVTSSTTATGLG